MTLPLDVPKPQFNDTFLSRLAYELATSLYTPEQVFSQFGIDKAYFFEHVYEHEGFRTYYREAHTIWNSTDSAMQRFTRKAGLLLEDFLPELRRILHDDAVPASSKATFVQWLSKVAGADNVHNAQRADGGGGTPTVIINLGGDQQLVLQNNPPPPPAVDVIPTQVTVEPSSLPPALGIGAGPLAPPGGHNPVAGMPQSPFPGQDVSREAQRPAEGQNRFGASPTVVFNLPVKP